MFYTISFSLSSLYFFPLRLSTFGQPFGCSPSDPTWPLFFSFLNFKPFFPHRLCFHISSFPPHISVDRCYFLLFEWLPLFSNSSPFVSDQLASRAVKEELLLQRFQLSESYHESRSPWETSHLLLLEEDCKTKRRAWDHCKTVCTQKSLGCAYWSFYMDFCRHGDPSGRQPRPTWGTGSNPATKCCEVFTTMAFSGKQTTSESVKKQQYNTRDFVNSLVLLANGVLLALFPY